MTSDLAPCPGCGYLYPGPVGRPHTYIGASMGCWSVYGQVLAKEYSEYRYLDVHRLTVDTYAAQHPGVPSRKSSQSVSVHLACMCLVLERGMDGATATRRIQTILRRNRDFEWLKPPAAIGSLTVADVLKASNLQDHTVRVRKWGESVWLAWSLYHGLIRKYVDLGADC